MMKINKSILLVGFAIMAIAQWFVPLDMISNQQKILNEGKIFKFKTAPVDPYDAFRGKYIHLNFENNSIRVKNYKKYKSNEEVYLTLVDSMGYAKIVSISKTKPQKGDFLKVKINYINNFTILDGDKPDNRIYFNYEFNRFYMNEYKAKEAETAYAETAIDDKYKTYALVAIKDGEAALKDVMINDISIKDYIEKGK